MTIPLATGRWLHTHHHTPLIPLPRSPQDALGHHALPNADKLLLIFAPSFLGVSRLHLPSRRNASQRNLYSRRLSSPNACSVGPGAAPVSTSLGAPGNVEPSAPVREARSEPARSTKLILEKLLLEPLRGEARGSRERARAD